MVYSDYNKTAEIAQMKVKEVVDGEKHFAINTGYDQLDEKIYGLRNGSLIVVGGRPFMGKTAFALNLVENIAVKGKNSVIYLYMEESASMLMERFIKQIARVEWHGSRKPEERESRLIKEATETIASSPIVIDDKRAMDVDELIERIRHYASANMADLIFLDYLQLVGAAKYADSYQEQISVIMRMLKSVAREIDKPIIILSQLNRTVEWRVDHHPMLSDLRGSESIEDEADVVLFLYRDSYYDADCDQKNIMEIDIAKNNYGHTGIVRLSYDATCCKLSQLKYNEKQGEEDAQ